MAPAFRGRYTSHLDVTGVRVADVGGVLGIAVEGVFGLAVDPIQGLVAVAPQ